MKYTMVTYDHEWNMPIIVDRFTANDHAEAYTKAKALFSEVRHLYCYVTVYFNNVSGENFLFRINDDDFV